MEIKILKNEQKIFHRVKKGETMSSIADCYAVSLSFLKIYNNIEEAEDGDVLFIPVTKGIVHIVKPRETLTAIAEKYGVSEKHILSVNPTRRFFIGQKIYL